MSSAFDIIQQLRERTTLDAQTRQSLLKELGSSIGALPAADFPQVLEFCGKLLEENSVIDRVIGLRTAAAGRAPHHAPLGKPVAPSLPTHARRHTGGTQGALPGQQPIALTLTLTLARIEP